MHVLVIEYEKGMAQKITDLLHEIDDSIRVVGITGSMTAAAEWLTRNKIPDLILTNERMMEDVDTKIARGIKAIVTFSTLHGNYNLAAFRYKTLLKFLHAMPGIEERVANIDDYQHNTIKLVKGTFKERFLVKQGQKLMTIPVGQIAYFFSQERFIFFRTFDNQKFLLEYRMEELEELLSPDIFFRINRSHIISIPAVKEIHAHEGNRLKVFLTPGGDKEVIVSRKRVNEFKDWLDK